MALEAIVGAEHGDIVPWVGKALLHGGGVEAKEAIEELGDEELVDEKEQFAGFGLSDLLVEPLALQDLGLNAFVLAAPIMVAAVLPEMKVLLIKARVTGMGQPATDSVVGLVGFKAGIEFIADFLWETGDFAAAFSGDRQPRDSWMNG